MFCKLNFGIDLLCPGGYNLLDILEQYLIDPLSHLTMKYALEFGGIMEDGIMRFTSYVDPDDVLHFSDSSIIDAINID